MKKIFKPLLLVSIVLLSNIFITDVSSLEAGNYELYPIKEEKEENILYNKKNNSVLKIVINKEKITKSILETNNTIVEMENERIEKERLEQERIERERIERERLERERLERERQIKSYTESYASFDSSYTDIVSFALQFVGNPYVAGGSSLTEGTDCSGFVMRVYEHFGVSLPRTAPAQATVGYAVSRESAQPGDIVSYGYNGIVSHSAIYIGNSMIVHASTPVGGIRVDNMNIMPIVTIRRIG